MIRVLLDSPDFSPQRVQRLRDKAMEPPEKPGAAIQMSLFEYCICEPVASAPCPAWCKPICRVRDVFDGCALRIITGELDQHFLFLFAIQSPMSAYFLSLRAASQIFPCMAGVGFQDLVLAASYFEHLFEVQFGEVVHAWDVLVTGASVIYVLPHMCFACGNRAGSHAEYIGLHSFIRDASPTALVDDAELDGTEATDGSFTIGGDLVEKFPWLTKYLFENRERGDTVHSSGFWEAPVLEEEAAAAAFAELEAHRALVAHLGPEEVGNDFRTSIRGGAWTAANRGVAFDSIRGSA